MNKIILVSLLIVSVYSYAQVGIGTTTPAAVFDIKASSQITPSNTDGILVPRIDAFPTTVPTAAQNGMIVFLTTAITGFPIGFYYWDNSITAWLRMDTGENYWKLSGNAGTTNGTDFIGTTDNRNLEFRVNNIIKTRITFKGQIETLNNNKSVFVGEGAGASINGSSIENTFVGYQAGFSNIYGNYNTATGANALYKNVTGNANTANGFNALYQNQNGSNNTANGANALYSNNGHRNTAMGDSALYANTGNGNTAIGANALDHNTSGNNNIALGYKAGSNITTGSHNIIIGNEIDAPSATDDNRLNIGNLIYATGVDGTGLTLSTGNVGIGVVNPVEKLDIGGAIRIGSESNSSTDGVIRWTGYDFEGYDGQEWLSLTRLNSVWGNTIPQAAENQIVTGSDTIANDYFGFAVSISGDYAIVGAPFADIGVNSDQGAAYIFKRNGDTWSQVSKIIAADGLTNDYFGFSVSIWSSTIDDTAYAIIGAFQADISGNSNQGAAYIFYTSGATWTQQAKITASDGNTNDSFGKSVSIYESNAIIGAINDDIGGNTNQGSAYIFNRAGTIWSQEIRITSSDGSSYDAFGSAVSIWENYAIIGSPLSKIGANTNQGAAYIYKNNGTTWGEEKKIIALDDGAAYDRFGTAVSIWGDYAIVGASLHDIGANTDQGAAYYFTRVVENQWGGIGKISDTYGASYDQFGNSVAMFNNYNIVGVFADDIGANNNQGSASIFRASYYSPYLETKVTASDGTADDLLGRSVAIYGNYAIIGASGSDKVYFISR